MDWKKESTMFDKVAQTYDSYRPDYPKRIIETIVEDTGLHRGSRILEIGSGSGIATAPFAGRGFDILCVEPGEKLIEQARKRFSDDEGIHYLCGRFEELDIERAAYDVILSAQAFHWVPQPAGYEKCAHALAQGGTLALMWNMYVLEDTPLDKELLELSNQYGGFADFLTQEGCEKRIASVCASIEGSGLFETPRVVREAWVREYTLEAFYGFVCTGNAFIQKSPQEKEQAFKDLQALAEKHGGMIRRPYLCVGYLSKKKA